jgi:hypothetical protein
MKRLALVLVVLALAAAAAACDEVESAGLTVNGEETSQSTIDDNLRDIRDNDVLAEVATQQGAELTISPGTISSTVTAGILGYVVRGEIAQQELDRLHVEVSDDDREAARQQAAQVFGSEEAFDAFPQSFQDEFIEWFAAVIVLQNELPDQPEFEAVFREADVDVNARYGKWSSENLAVLSPAALEQLDTGATPAPT